MSSFCPWIIKQNSLKSSLELKHNIQSRNLMLGILWRKKVEKVFIVITCLWKIYLLIYISFFSLVVKSVVVFPQQWQSGWCLVYVYFYSGCYSLMLKGNDKEVPLCFYCIRSWSDYWTFLVGGRLGNAMIWGKTLPGTLQLKYFEQSTIKLTSAEIFPL